MTVWFLIIEKFGGYQAGEDKSLKPIEKRSFGSFTGMALAAILGGLAGAIAGALFGRWVIPGNDFGGFGGLVGALGGMIIGFPFGVIAAIFIFSRLFRYRGSIWLAVLGAVVGAFLVMGLAEPLNLNSDSNLLLGTFVLVTVLLATWGFHLKRIENK